MTKTKILVGDKFIWNDAIRVEVLRTYKSGKICNARFSTILTQWVDKLQLPLSELFVPVESFAEFDSEYLAEHWGTGGPREPDKFYEDDEDPEEIFRLWEEAVRAGKVQTTDIEYAENLLLTAFGQTIHTKKELDELLQNAPEELPEEEFDEAMTHGEPVEVIGGRNESESGRSPDDDGSTTTEHLHEHEVRREENSGLPSHDPDAT